MKIISFIPARSGSKSIPHKNVKPLGEKPLIAYSIESSLKCGITPTVNTDNENYADIARQYGAEVQIRPQSLGNDDTSMFELLRSEIPKLDCDLVLLLQPTSPLRKSIHIKAAISYLTENIDKYDSIVSVERVPEKYNPYAMIIESHDKSMLFRRLIGFKEKLISKFTGKKVVGPSLSGYPISQRMTRRQDLPQCYLPTGDVYLFKASNLTKGSFYGENVMLLECESSININTEEDWKLAEEYLKQ